MAREAVAGRGQRLGYLLVAPALVALVAITGYPLVYNIWNSFHFDNLSYGGLPHKFVGWQDYTSVLKSSEWASALERTLVFTAVSVAFDIVVALGRAVIDIRPFQGSGLLGAVVVLRRPIAAMDSAMKETVMYGS